MKRIDLDDDSYELLRSIIQYTRLRYAEVPDMPGYVRRLKSLEQLIESAPDVPEHQR